jgi:hypothetical protein
MTRKYIKKNVKPPQKIKFTCLFCGSQAETTIPDGLPSSILQVIPLFCDSKCEAKWQHQGKAITQMDEQVFKTRKIFVCSVCGLQVRGIRGRKWCPNPLCAGRIVAKVVPI